MYTYRETYITRGFLLLFFCIVLAYGYFEARGYLFGPQIHVTTAPESTTEQFVIISGTVDHTTSFLVNGKEVAVTQDGQFHYPYLLARGNNQLYLDARDKYGSTNHQVVQVLYSPLARTSSTTTLPVASSSAPLPVATTTTLIQ